MSLEQFETRLSELRQSAKEENIPLSDKSAEAARATVVDVGCFHRPSIFLLDNGNIRFVWHSEAGDSVGWQFLPDGQIQFVMLNKESPPQIESGKNDFDEALLFLRQSSFATTVFP
jgi:hypothetical protein